MEQSSKAGYERRLCLKSKRRKVCTRLGKRNGSRQHLKPRDSGFTFGKFCRKGVDNGVGNLRVGPMGAIAPPDMIGHSWQKFGGEIPAFGEDHVSASLLIFYLLHLNPSLLYLVRNLKWKLRLLPCTLRLLYYGGFESSICNYITDPPIRGIHSRSSEADQVAMVKMTRTRRYAFSAGCFACFAFKVANHVFYRRKNQSTSLRHNRQRASDARSAELPDRMHRPSFQPFTLLRDVN